MPERFDYHRSVAPLMWVLVGLASVEVLVSHLLVAALVSRWVAAVLSLVTAAGVAWLVAAIVSMRRLPVELDGARLVMRVGWIKRIDLPVDALAGVRQAFDAASLKDGTTLNLALIAYPNVVIDLDPPHERRRTIRAVAHRLDDPAAFVRAVERLLAQR